MIALCDSTLKQMSVSGNTWSGTWTTISPDATNGAQFSNSIMHFVTYQGTLIMTTEARDKPQRLTSTDTSYKNLDFSGAGTAPLAKYCQVWKETVWLLNIGAGGQLTEDCGSLSGWTTTDVAAGTTSQVTFSSATTFRFHGGAGAGSDAGIKRTLSGLTTAYSVEIKTYFAGLSAITGGDYASLDINNGIVSFRTRWSTTGIQISDGTTFQTVGVGQVTTGGFDVWKFLVTAGTGTASFVDVLKNGNPIGLQYSVASVTTASSGQIAIKGNAGGSGTVIDWYMDYVYLNTISVRQNFFTDGLFATWTGTTQNNATDNVLPSSPFLHYKCNDNAGSSTVTDNGTGAQNGSFLAGAGTINTSLISVAGKIGQAYSFTSTSSHHVNFAAATVTSISTDAIGSFAFWTKPVANDSGQMLFSFSSGGGTNVYFFIQADDRLSFQFSNGTAFTQANVPAATISTGVYNHVAFVQDGVALKIFVNSSQQTITYNTGSTLTSWWSTLAGLSAMRLGNAQNNGSVESNFFTGQIDDFRYYRTALTSSDVAAIYGEGNGTEGHPTTVKEGTTIYLGTFSYRVNNDGQYALVSQSLASSSLIAGIPLYFGVWVNQTNLGSYKLRVDDGTSKYDSATVISNGTWQYNVLSFTPMSGATSIRAQVVSLSSGTMFIDMAAVVMSSVGIVTDFSDRLQRSKSGTYDTWTGGDSGTNDITTAGDVGLTGSFILQDRMYVTKAWNMYRITYTGSVPLLDIKQIKTVVGTRSPRSVKNVDLPGSGEIVIFLGTDRNIYVFDGFSSTPISDIVQLNNGVATVYTNNINTQALDKVFAINHSDLGWYEIFLPIGDATVPNCSLVFNYRNKAFWPFFNRNFTCGNVSDNASGDRIVYVSGATNGLTYQLNSTTSDDGAAINGYWTSFKLGQEYSLAQFDEISIITDSVNCTPTFSWRCNFETTYVTKTMKANTNKHNFAPERKDNLIQFKIQDYSTSAAFKFWHAKVLDRGIGIGT